MYGDIDVLELEGAWKWKEVGHVPGCIEFIQLGDVYSWYVGASHAVHRRVYVICTLSSRSQKTSMG